MANEEFVLVREISAPRELVYKAWTEPERLLQWFGPVGTKLTIKRADFKPGGEMVYGMTGPDGNTMWGRWRFRELTPPERIELVSSFLDENEVAIPHPMLPTMPVEMLLRATFEEKDGKTVTTLRSSALNATPDQVATFVSIFKGMEIGWGGTLDQLDVYLAKH